MFKLHSQISQITEENKDLISQYQSLEEATQKLKHKLKAILDELAKEKDKKNELDQKLAAKNQEIVALRKRMNEFQHTKNSFDPQPLTQVVVEPVDSNYEVHQVPKPIKNITRVCSSYFFSKHRASAKSNTAKSPLQGRSYSPNRSNSES